MKDDSVVVPATGDYTPPQEPPATPPIDSSLPQGFDSQNDPYRTGFWESSSAIEDETAALPEVPGFTIEKELGRGGMGVVYRARQTSLNRTVALKMILAGDHATAEAKARFLAEAEAIAKVQHPGIVQVHAFGTHQGNPYFALEYIDGGSLDHVLSKGPLLPQDAATLVAQLADAMEAAHQQGIVHRDLKPANVLLSFSRAPEARAKPAEARASVARLNDILPKITDFGLAKQIDAGPGLTATGAIMGTPSYMAPEQAAGKISQIGPATDVYALGAILYECLTGRTPFKGATAFDTIDQVLRQEPVPVRQLQPKVPKDVETICHKCLQKDPAKRYPTAHALADDLRNYLDGKPILARPVRRLERTWKWCKRYPAIAALMVVSVSAALLASGLASWAVAAERIANANEIKALKERNEKDGALQEKSKALEAESKALTGERRRLVQIEKGVEIFAGMLTGINPHYEEKGGPTLYQQLRDKAVKAADQLDAEAVGDPQMVARLQTILGGTLRELGEYPKAITILEKARGTRERELGADHPDTLSTLHNLALAYQGAGQQSQAIRHLEQVRAGQETKLGPEHPDTLTTLGNLARAYQATGKLPQAIRLLEQVRAVQETKLDPEHPDMLVLLNNLALAYQEAGQLPQAIRLYESVRTAQEKQLGPDHPSTLTTLANLAGAYRLTGKLPEAIRLYEQVRTARETKFGPDHPSTLIATGNLAIAYQAAGKITDAIRLLERLRTAQVTKLGPEHPDTLTTLGILAGAYRLTGKLPEAIRLYEQVRTTRETKFGPDHPSTLSTLANLAVAYQATGQLPEAIRLLERVSKAYETKLGPDHPNTLITLFNLARAYQLAGNLDKALPLYERASIGMEKRRFLHEYAGRIIPYTVRVYEEAQQWDKAESWQRKWLAVIRERAGTDHPAYASESAELGFILLRQEKWSEAEKTLRECLPILQKKEPDFWNTFNTQSILGTALLGQKKYAEAEPLLLQGYEGMKQREARIPPQSKVRLSEALERLVHLYEAIGKKDEAAKWQIELAAVQAATKSPGK